MPPARPPSRHAPARTAGTQASGLSGTDSGIWVREVARGPRPASTGCSYSPSPQPCPKSCAESTGSGFKCKDQSLLSPAGTGPRERDHRKHTEHSCDLSRPQNSCGPSVAPSPALPPGHLEGRALSPGFPVSSRPPGGMREGLRPPAAGGHKLWLICSSLHPCSERQWTQSQGLPVSELPSRAWHEAAAGTPES